jgi:dTDP-4-dehydrorhamnose 3,5-epimerase
MPDIVEQSTRPTAIDGLVVITMKQVSDERGTIREYFRRSGFEAAGLPSVDPFVQINVTESRRGAVRGLHAEEMTKIVAVVAGEAYGAYIDLRPASPTRGTVETLALVPGVQVLVPSGVANGFQALVDGTQYVYCFDKEWRPDMAGSSCNPLDPTLRIDWPLPIDPDNRAHVSAKDLAAPMVADLLQGAP